MAGGCGLSLVSGNVGLEGVGRTLPRTSGTVWAGTWAPPSQSPPHAANPLTRRDGQVWGAVGPEHSSQETVPPPSAPSLWRWHLLGALWCQPLCSWPHFFHPLRHRGLRDLPETQLANGSSRSHASRCPGLLTQDFGDKV